MTPEPDALRSLRSSSLTSRDEETKSNEEPPREEKSKTHDELPAGHLPGELLMWVLILSAPTVLAGMAIGFMISLFQAVTQIQEVTLTFVPKIIAVFVVLLISGGWMIEQITEFTQTTWNDVAAMVRT